MAHPTRRQFAAGLTGLTGSLIATNAFGQSALSPQQLQEYARVYGAKGAGQASLRELNTLRALQEGRLNLPKSQADIASYIKNSPAIKEMQDGKTPELGVLMFWHGVVMDATAADHTTVDENTPAATFGEQLGPTRASRALAIIHLAIFEAVNAIHKRYQTYNGIQNRIYASIAQPQAQQPVAKDSSSGRLNQLISEEGSNSDGTQKDGAKPGASRTVTPETASTDAAIVAAAHATLSALFPKKVAIFDVAREQSMVRIGHSDDSKALGLSVGRAAAAAALALRQGDGSELPEPSARDLRANTPLDWIIDPISQLDLALGGNWPKVKPFVLQNAAQFRPAPPPALNDAAFVAAYKQVKRLGGDPNAPNSGARAATATIRTGTAAGATLDDANETFKGIFWAYDGTPSLCAPPRLYNSIATSIALNERPIRKVDEMARFLAILNLTLADAGIAAWEAKYHFNLSRPVTTIRVAGVDDTADGRANPTWTPLGAPVTNGGAGSRNLSPPFPAYPSGHATFGGALFETMRLYWGLGPEGVPFEFVSDEYNGRNRGPGEAQPRPLVRRRFPSFAAAETENGFSRIWLGIHWSFDADAGVDQGRKVARYTHGRLFQPVG